MTAHVEPYYIVEHYTRAGDVDNAIRWLEICFEKRCGWIGTIHIDPALDSIRSDPRFIDIQSRAGLDRWVTGPN